MLTDTVRSIRKIWLWNSKCCCLQTN